MPRGIPNSKLDVSDMIVQMNKDTGMQVVNLFPGVIYWHKYDNQRLLSDSIKLAFDTQTLIQLTDYMMPEGFYDVNQCHLFIQEMGFEEHVINGDFEAFKPWNNQDLVYLSSWEPGANVNPFGYWSDIGKGISSNNVERIDFNRYLKYNSNKYFAEHDELDFDNIYDMPENKNWRDKREKEGLYSIEEGRKLKYEEKNGFNICGKLWKWPLKRIEALSDSSDHTSDKDTSTIEQVIEHHGRRRRCRKCGNLFYRDEMNGWICKGCSE